MDRIPIKCKRSVLSIPYQWDAFTSHIPFHAYSHLTVMNLAEGSARTSLKNASTISHPFSPYLLNKCTPISILKIV